MRSGGVEELNSSPSQRTTLQRSAATSAILTAISSRLGKPPLPKAENVQVQMGPLMLLFEEQKLLSRSIGDILRVKRGVALKTRDMIRDTDCDPHEWHL